VKKKKNNNADRAPQVYGNLDKISSKKSRSAKKKPVLIFVLLGLLLLSVGGFVFVKLWAGPPQVSNQQLNTPEHEGDLAALPETTDKPLAAPPDKNAGKYTFAVVGMDKFSKMTDVILLVMFDTAEHKLNVVSVPRDTLVNIPENVKKINILYAYGDRHDNGVGRLMDGLRDFVGFDIGNYIVVNLQAFEELIDAIGGVDYDVPIDMVYRDRRQDLNINIKKGMQHLNGAEALKVVRFRAGYANADIGRIATQQDFMKAVAKQLLKAKNIANLPEIIRIITENTETNLTAANITYFAGELLKCKEEDINFHTMPRGGGSLIKGISYVFVHIDDWIDMINSYLNPLDQLVTAKNVNLVIKAGAGYFSTRGGIAGGPDSFLNFETE
jgi:LCP family protein required for cell wall assembly